MFEVTFVTYKVQELETYGCKIKQSESLCHSKVFLQVW